MPGTVQDAGKPKMKTTSSLLSKNSQSSERDVFSKQLQYSLIFVILREGREERVISSQFLEDGARVKRASTGLHHKTNSVKVSNFEIPPHRHE